MLVVGTNLVVVNDAKAMLSTKFEMKDMGEADVILGIRLKKTENVCYAHIPSLKRSKLDAKAERGIFLGYDSQAKGYQLFNLSNKKIMINRDFEFDEDASWNWEEEKVEKKFFQVDSEVHDEPRDENIEEAPSTPILAKLVMMIMPRLLEELSWKSILPNSHKARSDVCSKFAFKVHEEPSDVHMGAARRVLSKTKHMKIKFYALREAEQEKEVKLIHCPTEFQLTDILTKALPKSRFEFLRLKLGMMAKSLKEQC
uniref:Retroviral polymerase SH3-like domain-containing protein n=1 Tax=Chenopodium quinoa TaxID=63459 RepID=A0A803LSF4_CHEQI